MTRKHPKKDKLDAPEPRKDVLAPTGSVSTVEDGTVRSSRKSTEDVTAQRKPTTMVVMRDAIVAAVGEALNEFVRLEQRYALAGITARLLDDRLASHVDDSTSPDLMDLWQQVQEVKARLGFELFDESVGLLNPELISDLESAVKQSAWFAIDKTIDQVVEGHALDLEKIAGAARDSFRRSETIKMLSKRLN